jgi:hypothetical protein
VFAVGKVKTSKSGIMPTFGLALFLCALSGVTFSADVKAKVQADIYARSVSLNGNDWRIAVDGDNVGRQRAWFREPPMADSRQTPVPWVIQDIFHDYHGVAWYWREFEAPPNPHQGGRYLLRFRAVDYLADVWVNGSPVGGHEGGETPFELDVTAALKHDGRNLLVVRVLNPTYQPIDGIALKDTPSGAKQYPFTSNAVYNSGGVIGDVELAAVPAVRLSDLSVVPDWKTGKVRIRTTLLNAQPGTETSSVSFSVSEAGAGSPLASERSPLKLEPGSRTIEVEIQVPHHELWSPDNPHLYRLTASVRTLASVHERSLRFGFRDFRFENGYFRLNGKRIFLRGSNFSTHYPVGFTVPPDEDMLRRDVVNMKALGFNFVRLPFGCPNPRVLDIYDELGILVQQEHYGCWQMGDYGGYKYPKPDNAGALLLARFENSIRGVVERDRNHVSVVMWGVLNENADGIIFRRAVASLPALRTLDPSRVFVLNSGRFDGLKDIGSLSNPGSPTWDVREDELKDWHPYVWMPYSPKTLDELSGRSDTSRQKIYVSETGLCFPIDLPAELGDYEQRGKEQADDARYFRRQYDKFLADWARFDLGACWARPEDYIRAAYATASSLRETAEAAIRSNPYIVSYTPTNSVADYSMGESVATNFRRLKPELIGSVLLANAPVRWCLSTEPQSLYRGHQVQLRASFSNLDVLPASKYPATVQVFGPDLKCVFEKNVPVDIPEARDGREPPFAQTVLTEDITINGPAGEYRFLATLDRGGPAVGGKTEFYVTDEAGLPGMPREIVLCGSDAAVSDWLTGHKVKVVSLDQADPAKRQVIVMAGKAPEPAVMLRIARDMACGSSVIFLSPATFKSGNDTTRWLPLVHKGKMETMDLVAGYYRADRWAKNHPLFDGLPSGGMMDYKYFRNLISPEALSQEYVVTAKSGMTHDEASLPLTYPAEAVCGSTRISYTYCSGVHVGVWNFGQGRFIVNTLHVAENLGRDPAADRLFGNMLDYAARDIRRPPAKLPEDFDRQLKEIGYRE